MRITTRTPKTTQTTLSPASEDYYTNVDYDETTVAAVFESKLVASTIPTFTASTLDSLSTEAGLVDGEDNSLFYGEAIEAESTTSTAASNLELKTNAPASTASSPEVHETADKHSTFAPDSNPLEAILEAVEVGNAGDVLTNLELDIQNEIGVDQEFEESQQVQQAWHDDQSLADSEDKMLEEEKLQQKEEEGEAAVVTTAKSRLTSYEKKIDTSLFGGEFSSSGSGNEDSVESTVNEHGQQQVEAGSEAVVEDITSLRPDNDQDGWRAVLPVKPYVELDRSAPKPTASVEEVPITESKDYTEPDVFYDVHKEGFEETTAEGKEVYNFPVSVQLNIPETTTAEITTPTAAVVEEKTTVTVDEVVPTTEIDVAEQTTTTVYNNPVSTSAPATAAATTTQEPLKTTTVFAEPTTTTPSAPLTDGHQVRFVLSTLKEVKLQVTFQGKSACFVNISTFLLKGLSIKYIC